MRWSKMRAVLAALVTLTILTFASEARGQRMTERYIPLGESPGLSGRYTTIGEIREIDAEERTVTVAAPDDTVTVEIEGDTFIWLDRSQQGRTNLDGELFDLQPGRRAEIRYRDYETRESAEWIKVVVPPDG